MDEVTSGLDPDELMDLDDAEGSDLDEDEEDNIDDPIPSPLQLPSSGPGSTATSTASSPPNNDDAPPAFNFSGKPLNIKRGRGRPRREGGKPLPRRGSGSGGGRMKRWKSPGQVRGIPKRVRSFDRGDFDFSSVMSSPSDDLSFLDPETGSLILPDKDRSMPAPEELPFNAEQWPGKACAFCNLGERSQLGQGELLRLTCPEGFTPQRVITEQQQPEPSNSLEQLPEREVGDKSPRGPVTCRRQKSFNKCRHPSMTSEYVDELTIIGYVEEPDVQSLFESAGYFYVHRSCALWSHGVVRIDSGMDNVGPTVLHSSSKKCSHCNHYGGSLVCKMEGCSKIYHFPCATASGAFQELSTTTLYCNQHLTQVLIACETSVCYTCKILGDVANLMYCSSCGEHYHGTCVGLAQLPGVRAGWQCRRCRQCQVCRMSGDETKLMACEQCDKVYHSMCQRPIVTSIPKYGWKCRCCRVCGDCGSRTPGAGLSSRWHAHYTVCDSCYQQRNKGFSCPLCHRAYRAHAHREMVQCALCRKFVHGTCDPEADLTTYHQRKEITPEYEYVCLICKNITQQGRLLSKRNSIEDGDLSASQESLFDESEYDFDRFNAEEVAIRPLGLGRGKPYSASKVAKKRLGLGTGMPGRPKGIGKSLPGKVGFMKRQRLMDFGRKRGPKSKMRGIFGVPGVGLQRPTSDGSKTDEEPGVENRLVLCSAKDKFVLTQDICVMCGALGTNQEGCLIACVQCGQCYHPYCVSVKVTKVLLQKGWRCLDCTVCEGCGQRNDEARLILCDECDISYHIYCMDPPLDYVPHGNWKCKWCAICTTCGSTEPGANCNWMNSFSECGPCASMTNCPHCLEPYNEGDLIIQCLKCERWLHGGCDSIKTELDAERCAEEGYTCLLCRPRDVLPPHLMLPAPPVVKPPTPTKSPEIKSSTNYFVDGVYLSEIGHSLIKALSVSQQGTRKKRKKPPTLQDKEAGIMATIESVIASSSVGDNSMEDTKLELVDVKEEPREAYMEGMEWSKENGPPPEGFTILTVDSGSVLRRKRQRNLQKLGIGGFLVRNRGIRSGQDNDDIDILPGQSTSSLEPPAPPATPIDGEKPRRKPVRRKPKSKLSEMFPSYIQEAFFGKELMDTNKIDSSSCSDEEVTKQEKSKTIQLSQDELKAVAAVTAKVEKKPSVDNKMMSKIDSKAPLIPKEEDESDTEAFKDVLALPGDLIDNDLVNTIMNGDDDELSKNTDALEGLAETLGSSSNSKDTKDELSDILGSHFNLESIPNINSKDVEDIFKGVLTDESQESQESNVFPISTNSVFPSAAPQQPIPHLTSAVRPTTLQAPNNLNSPGFPPQSPYHSEYSNSPQFSPAFSEPLSPWVNVDDPSDLSSSSSMVPSTYNQRSSDKMKADEGLGSGATISAVLYANMNHPEWKTEFKTWSDRYKQIIKKWRTLSTEQKAPYLQQAKDNRSALRMKKQQQITKESASSPTVTKSTAPVVVTSAPPTQVPAAAPVTEVCTPHTRPTPSLTIASTSSVSVSPCTTPRPASLPNSPPTQHQFTVHGHLFGPGDHVGPAPNVTVNPLYQPSVDKGPTPPPRPSAPPPAADQQIRVLTPSEIMRTLPSLCQENYEPQPLDQEKIAQQQKSAREAEQERQWKQLQALRQQQAAQQQHVIQEQRVQAIARVQRQITDIGSPLLPEQTGVLQVTTSQELSPTASPSPSSRPFPSMGMKSPPFTHPTTVVGPRPTTPSQSPHELPTASASQTIDFQRATETNDPYSQTPATPKPQIISGAQQQSNVQGFQPRMPSDPYAQQPGTPRPSFATPRPSLQGFGQAIRPGEAPPELNRQLRDLLQRQQFKKLDEQLLPGKGQQRVWPPPEVVPEQEQPSASQTPGDATFRHPLPPGIIRARGQIQGGGIVRQAIGVAGLRMQAEPRLQGLDPRTRLLLQQQRPTLHQFPGQIARFQAPVRPTNMEQYEQLLQRPQLTFQPRQGEQLPGVRMPVTTASLAVQRSQISQPSPAPAAQVSSESSEQEIPDNVTAELEKLEQEGSMVELQGVGDILGGLDDDDELLAEMGADFNILEYADPELDALTGGEKTNILDSLDLVDAEPDKDEKKENKTAQPPQTAKETVVIKTEASSHAPNIVVTSSSSLPENIRPPPLAVSQPQATHHPPQQLQAPTQLTPQQQIHHQMLAQVQQAAAMGRPIAPGTKLMSTDGVIGIVNSNNNVSITFPHNYQQRLLQLQNQKLQMRLGQLSQTPRLLTAAGQSPILHGGPVGLSAAPRLNVPAAQPPPPPYPGPPPPYPGSSGNQMGLRMGPSPMGQLRLPLGLMHPVRPQGHPMLPHMQRRPLLLEEQPLLLEDLLEQEKREQEKQHQTQPSGNQSQEITSSNSSGPALLSDHDFERLKADVLSSGPIGLGSSNATAVPAQGMLPVGSIGVAIQGRNNFPPRSAPPSSSGNQWQQNPPRPASVKPQPQPDMTPRVPVYNANLLPAPPLPPEHIVTEQDKQTQMVYESWLNHQNDALQNQLKFYMTEVTKLRKIRKSLNSKQRQLKKSGNQLAEGDAMELQRIQAEQSIIQKHLESSRKQSRQHEMLIQEYRNKQQAKQRPGPGQSPLQMGQIQSPLRPPASSPIHPASQSPMMSPSASPMMQHNSPLHSPAPVVSHSPGPGSMSNVMQSPGNSQQNASMSPMQPSPMQPSPMQPSPMQPSPMQPSPRIGTPLSQSEGSPGPVQSPSQIHLPPPMTRMTSPQHRRVVTSPVGYSGEIRPNLVGQTMQQVRFGRPTLDTTLALQQRARLQSPSPNFQQKPGTPSPLNSPPPQQIVLTQQQLLQRHLQQQALLQQQQQNQQNSEGHQQPDLSQSPRTIQLIQQRHLIMRQQQQQLAQHQQLAQQQQLGQQQLNQPQLGQPQLGQPQLGQPQLAQQLGQQLGQQQMGQQQLSQQQLGQQQLGQQQLGQQQLGQQQLGQQQLGQQQLGQQQLSQQQLGQQQLSQQQLSQQITQQQLGQLNQQLGQQPMGKPQLSQQQQGVVQPPPLTPHQHQLMVQQQQQLAKQQQQQIAAQLQAQASRIPQQVQADNAARTPQSPMLNQAQQIMSPHSIHSQPHSQPASPMPPRSPMVGFGNQPPSSPIARSPSVHQMSPSIHQMNQPPSSPMMHPHTPQYPPSSSPMPRSPMVGPIQSPMSIRRHPGSSPANPERPLSIENPGTPRNVYTPQPMSDTSSLPDSDHGGGNPHNPANPIPYPPNFGRFGYFKLGLRGGSPMWGLGRGAKRPPTMGENKEEKSEMLEQVPEKYKKQPHLTKVSILKKNKTSLQGLPMTRVNSLVSSDYNEFDDSSSTPPVTPPPSTSRLKSIGKKLPGEPIENKEHLMVSKEQMMVNKEQLVVNKDQLMSKEQLMVVESSSDTKQIRVDEIMDYEDDNDNNVVSTEVSLSSTAQNDGDDITVIQTFSQSDLGDVISSPLESDQMDSDFLLFPVDISENAHEEDEEEFNGDLVNMGDKNMHIVNVAIQSPTTSEEEMILQGKTKKVTSDGLKPYIVQGLSSEHLLSVTDTPDSPEPEEMNVDPPESPEEEMSNNFEAPPQHQQIVIINTNRKSPEESISTKEDFEELIDEGSRKEKMIKTETKHVNVNANTNVFSYPPKTISATNLIQGTILGGGSRNQNLVTLGKPGQKISLVPIVRPNTPRKVSDVILTGQNPKVIATSNYTSIILPSARSNIITVPKLVTSVSPALTIVSGSTTQIASMLPSRFTVPVISASVVNKLPNVKVMDKPSTSMSLSSHQQDTCLPKKIFEDDSVSPDSSNCEDDKSKQDSSPEVLKIEDPLSEATKHLGEKVNNNKVHPLIGSTENGITQSHIIKTILKDDGLKNLVDQQNIKLEAVNITKQKIVNKVKPDLVDLTKDPVNIVEGNKFESSKMDVDKVEVGSKVEMLGKPAGRVERFEKFEGFMKMEEFCKRAGIRRIETSVKPDAVGKTESVDKSDSMGKVNKMETFGKTDVTGKMETSHFKAKVESRTKIENITKVETVSKVETTINREKNIREAIPNRESLVSREAVAHREAISNREMIANRELISNRELIASREAVANREAIVKRDTIGSRETTGNTETIGNRETISNRESITNREATRETIANREMSNREMSNREFTTNRDTMGKVETVSRMEAAKIEGTTKIENIHLTNLLTQNNRQRTPSPVVTKSSPPLLMHSTPELKMTAQIIQELQPAVQIASRAMETMSASFITTQSLDGDGISGDLDSKSVVISIPSPTPSQEQMLDNIAMQALENRRRDGKGISGEFESFEDVLDMIENITADPAPMLENSIDEKMNEDDCQKTRGITVMEKEVKMEVDPEPIVRQQPKVDTQVPVTVATTSRATTMPQLSPLSQPAELTTNMANVSQQLRTLLSSLHTTTVTTSANVETVVKSVTHKEKVVPNVSAASTNAIVTSRVAHQFMQQSMNPTSIIGSNNTVIVPNLKQKMILSNTTHSPQNNSRTQSPTSASTNSATVSMASANSITTSSGIPTSLAGTLLQGRIQGGIQLMPDHPKLPPVTIGSMTIGSANLGLTNIGSANVGLANIGPTTIGSATIGTATMGPVTLGSTSIGSTSVGSTSTGSICIGSTTFSGSASTQSAFTSFSKQSVITSSIQTSGSLTHQVKKPSLTLNAMLQSHPAATMPQTLPSTITTASILGSPSPMARSAFNPSLIQAQPRVQSPITSSVSTSQNTTSSSLLTAIITSTQNSSTRPTVSTTNILHEHLMKASVIRTKSTEEPNSTNDLIKKEDVKTEPADSVTDSIITAASLLKQEPSGGCKFSSIQTPNRMEDSQNVLLKQLLQNTACAGSSSQLTTPTNSAPIQTAPSLPIVPNLEAQLARPVPPTPTSLLPPILQNDTSSQSKAPTSRSPLVTRETSFVSKPIPQAQTIVTSSSSSQQLHIDIKKCLPPSRTPSRDDLLSPPTPRSSCSQDSSLQTPPLTIKKENITAQQSPLLTPQEVKKELVDESSQHSEVSDHSRPDIQMKEELVDCLESSTEKMTPEQKEELKKLKRRRYQQKRRLNQIMNKEGASGQPKKRPRKSSKLEEDYDSYIEGVIAQMRTLPPLVVSEPVLNKNFGVVPVFGSGDLSKVGMIDFDPRNGDLSGSYGSAFVPGYTDYYNSKPYGDIDPMPEKPPASTQRGFYDQEFPLIKFDTDDDKKFNLFCRDDSPDSILSSSSPECSMWELEEPSCRFTGLRLISDNEDDDDEVRKPRAVSPPVPIIMPIPIKLKPAGPFLKDITDDKENINQDCVSTKSKFGSSPSTPLKDSGNVTVTLTLTSSAAEDIMGVLRDLANILHIPAPTSYQIVERTSTPPSQKLGLYRTKGKDGKEGAPIDIQSILNGAAKFCKHCDVVILNNMIRKKVTELPFFTKDSELIDDGDELFFCTTTCYMQFALMHRSPTLTEDKAAAIVDHLCQKDKADTQRKKQMIEKQKLDNLLDFQKKESQPQPVEVVERMEVDYDMKSDIKMEEDFTFNLTTTDYQKPVVQAPPAKSWKGIKYKKWAPGCLQAGSKYKRPTDKDIMELLYRLGITVTPAKIPDDTRKCMFCHAIGDGVADGPGRLLNFDVDKWVHLNCGLWSDGVYETVNGALMNLENAIQQSLSSNCFLCNKLGATIRCFKTRCSNIYHLSCAVKDGCVFYKNKTTYCTAHVQKTEKDNELTTLSVSRRVYVNRDENRQVAAVMHHSETNNLLRVGSLIFLSVGQLLPHQLQNFHTSNYIYPIGYKIIRFYWSMRRVNKRCRYVCSIHEVMGRPEFRILVQEQAEEDLELKDTSPKAVWSRVLEPLASLRRENRCVQIFPKYVTGEDLFGLTEPAVVRVLESLPGIETLTDYKFKYGRNPLLELPLAINPSGAARSEPRLRSQLHWKRAHTQRTATSARPVFVPAASAGTGEAACPYSKQFVHSKSSQYKKMKQEWRNNVFLARSKIQGLGLYAARDLEKHTMVIEYIGEIIRTEVAETREKKYEAKNRGIYMFRLDEDRVVDATLSGGLARYINHSCNPNCVAEIVEVDRDLRIIIFAKRRIQRGEELAYDYKFDIEDDQHKISCMCGAPNCKKWMN